MNATGVSTCQWLTFFLLGLRVLEALSGSFLPAALSRGSTPRCHKLAYANLAVLREDASRRTPMSPTQLRGNSANMGEAANDEHVPLLVGEQGQWGWRVGYICWWAYEFGAIVAMVEDETT